MDFFSMGMFCIDEIHTPETSFTDVIGGAGTYAVLGAAVLLPRASRRTIGFVCDEGHDFPDQMHNIIESWGLHTIFRRDDARETTKAWNKFVANEERLFKYLSPKKQIFVEDMPSVARGASVVHLICSPPRAAEFLRSLKTQRTDQAFVWEPVPTECTPSQFAHLKSVVGEYDVDVLSPNSLEAASLVGLPEPSTKAAVEALVADHFAFASTIIVRCGALGCFLRTLTHSQWYAPFYENRPDKIVDPSGAGNAFMGGLGLALSHSLDWDKAIAFASVASSFMLEQIGPPVYEASTDMWNGERGADRIRTYIDRLPK